MSNHYLRSCNSRNILFSENKVTLSSEINCSFRDGFTNSIRIISLCKSITNSITPLLYWWCKSTFLLIRLSWSRLCVIQTLLCEEHLLGGRWTGEAKMTRLLRYNSALVFWGEAWD